LQGNLQTGLGQAIFLGKGYLLAEQKYYVRHWLRHVDIMAQCAVLPLIDSNQEPSAKARRRRAENYG